MDTIRGFLKLLMEDVTYLLGEYWITAKGDLIEADSLGDSPDEHSDSHTDVILKRLLKMGGRYLGDEALHFGDDFTALREWLNDVWIPAHYGYEEEDPFERLKGDMARTIGEVNARGFIEALSVHGADLREFAIKEWNWIRLTDGNHFTVRQMDAATLRRVADAAYELVYDIPAIEKGGETEDLEVYVELWTGPSHLTTVGNLEQGRLDSEEVETHEDRVNAAASKKITQMDRDAVPSFYKGRLGD